MRYIALDIETTGLDPMNCGILEIGAIIDDSNPEVFRKTSIKNLPRFHAYIWNDLLNFEIIALKMNWELLDRILFNHEITFIRPEEVTDKFVDWLIQNDMNHSKITFAGKNFGAFDKRFLEYQIPGWTKKVQHHSGSFDPGEYMFKPREDNEKPNLYECAARLGLEVSRKHNALEDCEIVIACLRWAWKEHGPMDYPIQEPSVT